MGFNNKKFGIENLSKPTIEEAQAELEKGMERIEDPEILNAVRSIYKKTKKQQIEDDLNNPKVKDYTKKKSDYSNFARTLNDKEEDLKRVSNHYTVLKSKDFEDLHHSTLKRGDGLYLHLKTGNSIHISNKSINLIQNDLPVTKEASLDKEVKTMIALAFENNMKNIRLTGDDDSLKIAFEEIRRINSLVKDEKNKIFVIPNGPEQERLFKEIINPGIKENHSLNITEVSENENSNENIDNIPKNDNKKKSKLAI